MSLHLIMFDDAYWNLLPAGADAYAAYLDGNFQDFAAVKALFPGARLLGIVVNPDDNGDVLDVESGAAKVTDAPAWSLRQIARGIARPVIYCSVSLGQSVLGLLAAAGIPRESSRLWTAHYGLGAHICDAACGFGEFTADGTQYTDSALGRSLDESLLNDDFFSAPAITFPIGDGVIGTEVLALQKMLDKWAVVIGLAPLLTPDGVFGPKTAAAVTLAQRFWHYAIPLTETCDLSLWNHLTASAPAEGTPETAPDPLAIVTSKWLVTASWPAVGGATEYQIDILGLDNSQVCHPIVSQTHAVVSIKPGSYLVKARAGNISGWGPWGATKSFAVPVSN